MGLGPRPSNRRRISITGRYHVRSRFIDEADRHGQDLSDAHGTRGCERLRAAYLHRRVKSAQYEANARRIALLLDAVSSVLPIGENDARASAEIRAGLEAVGRPIGPYGILIAGQALARDLVLVTSNRRRFARIKGLWWEDWAKAN